MTHSPQVFRHGGVYPEEEGAPAEVSMRVKDIMTSRVETVDQEEIAEAAYNLMRLRKIHHLVVTGGGEIVGILSERDLGDRDRETQRQRKSVESFMTPYAVKERPDMTVKEAANLMRGWTIG